MKTVTRLFDDYRDGESAARDLEAMGFKDNDLSILSSNADEKHRAAEHEGGVAESVGVGATTGAVIGGGAGLLAGLGMLAIPGIGPVVAAGWLAATALGAGVGAVGGGAAGGIIGALRNSGHTEEEAHVYAEGVRRGGTLVSVKVRDEQVAEVEDILRRHQGVDAATRGPIYREAGWSSFDENAPAYRGGENALGGNGKTEI